MFLRSLAPLSFLAVVVAGCNTILGYDSAVLVPGGSDAGAVDPNGCAAYCSTIQTNCTGDNAEYINTSVCMQICQTFEPGVPGDESQNSLACRIWHSTAAASDPSYHCHHAGPLGGGVCGSDPCAEFCTLVQGECSSQPDPPYANVEDCSAACPTFNYDQATGQGDLSEESGNTLNCRIYHLESAFNTSEDVDGGFNATAYHCPHTAVVSATCN